MGRTVERSLYDNIFGKFHRARLEFEQLAPSVACWRSGRYSCSGLIAVEAAGRWLLLLGDPKSDQGKVLEARELLAPVRAGSLKASTRSTSSRLRRYSVSSAPDNEFRNGL